MKNKIAITDYISAQQYFILPLESWPEIRMEIYNKHNKQFRKVDFDICIKPHGKKKKTDRQIKISY